MSDAEPILATSDLMKAFGITRVLDGISFELRRGEVHALVGENGAGKSTLGKILSGVYQPDSGDILMDGKSVRFGAPLDAQAAGVVMIYQEPTLFPDLDVAENILMGQQPVGSPLPLILRRAMYARAREILTSIGARFDVRAPIAQLSVADQQLVEIGAALARNARVVIMDEPTASLTPHEVEDLFQVIRQLRDRGVSILFVSHRLEEVFAISNRITVLRDGHLISTTDTGATTRDTVIREMVGRDLDAVFVKEPVPRGDIVLETHGLTRRGTFAGIDLQVHRGEIVGLAGLVGAGRSEVARAIFGIDPLDSGEVVFEGKRVRIRSARDAVALGLAFVPEDRQHQGLVLSQPIAHNMTLTILREISTAGLIRGQQEQKVARSLAERLQLRARDLGQPAAQLSGGNQQKIVLAKWLVRRPKLLILDEPTRGIDVGAKAEVHRFMSELVGQGVAILMISSELPEIMAMSDCIVVMREGRVTARYSRHEATPERIMSAATGQTVAVAGAFE